MKPVVEWSKIKLEQPIGKHGNFSTGTFNQIAMKKNRFFPAAFLLLWAMAAPAQEDTQCYCAAEAFSVEADRYAPAGYSRNMPYALYDTRTKAQGNREFVFKQSRVDTFRYSSRPATITEGFKVFSEDVFLPIHPKAKLPLVRCDITGASGYWHVWGDGAKVDDSDIAGQLSFDEEREDFWRFAVRAATADVKKGRLTFSARGVLQMKDKRLPPEQCLHGRLIFHYRSVHIWEELEDENEEQGKMPLTQETEEKVGMTLESTGRTIGAIAEARLHNHTREAQTVELGPWIITGDLAHQPYVTLPVAPVHLKPGETVVVPIPGVCLDPFTPPVPVGHSIPAVRLIDLSNAQPFNPAASLLERPDFTYLDADPPDGIYPTLPGTDQPFFGTFNFEWAPELSAALIYDIVSRITETVDELIATEQMPPNPYTRNPEFLAEAAKGQTVWLVISRLLHPDSVYTQEHLETNLRRQYREQTGTELAEAPPAVQEQFEQGADELFSLFVLVGEQAKVLNTPAERATEGPPTITTEALRELEDRLLELDPRDPHAPHELERIRKDFEHFGPNPDLDTSRFTDALRESDFSDVLIKTYDSYKDLPPVVIIRYQQYQVLRDMGDSHEEAMGQTFASARMRDRWAETFRRIYESQKKRQ